MTWIRRLALPTLVALLGLGAAPARATLLVKSDSTGLLVQDKNGIGDNVVVSSGTQGGNPVYVVTNNNSLDVFKFEFGSDCSQGATGNKAVCKRISGKLNLAMVGGDDQVQVVNSGASSASANLGSGSDTYTGIPSPDNVFTGSGDDDVTTLGGNDDVRTGSGFDRVAPGSGDDEISEGLSPASGELGVITAGSGNDNIHVAADSQKRLSVSAGSGDDTVVGGVANDDVTGGTGLDSISTHRGEDSIRVKESEEEKLAERDTVKCGFDDDEVTADLKDDVDSITSAGGGTCEEVDRSPVGETPHVRILSKALRVSTTGKVNVRLRCPRGVKKLGCKGRLQLRIARTRKRGVQASRSRKVGYRIRAGKRKRVTLRLSSKDVKRLGSRQRRGTRTRGILVSIEKGRKGRKTTVRNPRLKLRTR